MNKSKTKHINLYVANRYTGIKHTQQCNTYIKNGNEQKVNSYAQTHLYIGKQDTEQNDAYGYKNSYHIL